MAFRNELLNYARKNGAKSGECIIRIVLTISMISNKIIFLVLMHACSIHAVCISCT